MTRSPRKIQPAELASAASSLSVSVATIRAVTEVESRGDGFMDDGHPVILFERHVMYRQLRDKFGKTRADQLSREFPSLVNPQAGGYGRESEQPRRLERAAEIDRECALNSASWGAFQIMGYHWRALGYASQQTFINAMYKSEGGHLFAFCRFIQVNPSLHQALKNRNWAAFAKGYNGPEYAKNSYDTKMAAAYARLTRETA